MPFCPNPECPHFKETGKPAEFMEGSTRCSDCGTPLSGQAIPEAPEKEKPGFKLPLNIIQKPLLFTLGMLAIARIATHIPVPGINGEALGKFVIGNGGSPFLNSIYSRMNVLALGLMPYINAFILVEILSLFLKPLKLWRRDGYARRRKLKRTALYLSVVFAFLQGYFIAQELEGMNGGLFVSNPGIGFRLILMLTLAAGTFILIWLAEQITKRGIGNGISMIIFASYSARLISGVGKIGFLVKQGFLIHSTLEYLVFLGVLSAVLAAIVLFMEKSYKRIAVNYNDGFETCVPFKVTTAGIVPASWAVSLIMLPATLVGFTNNEFIKSISIRLSPGSIGHLLALFIAVVILYYFFTSLFYRPAGMINSLKKQGVLIKVPGEKEPADYIDRTLEIMALLGAIYLCLLLFMPDVFSLWLHLPFYFGGVGFIITIAIGLDFTVELFFRMKSGPLARIAEFHDVPKAGLCKSVLEQKGIPCHLQGYYHRALLYFLGPFISMYVLVPEARASEASELIEKYVNKDLLVQGYY